MPLTFASAIVRYRLRDIEVIIKRALVYTAFLAASALLYVAMQQLVAFAFANDADPHNTIVAVLATAVVVLLAQPVKEAVQNALDRVFYRDRYDYRRALVAFARDRPVVARLRVVGDQGQHLIIVAEGAGDVTLGQPQVAAIVVGIRPRREQRRPPVC